MDEILSICIEEEYYIEPDADYSELYAALHSIKEKERRVFLARVLDEKSFDEIAEELGLSYSCGDLLPHDYQTAEAAGR